MLQRVFEVSWERELSSNFVFQGKNVLDDQFGLNYIKETKDKKNSLVIILL